MFKKQLLKLIFCMFTLGIALPAYSFDLRSVWQQISCFMKEQPVATGIIAALAGVSAYLGWTTHKAKAAIKANKQAHVRALLQKDVMRAQDLVKSDKEKTEALALHGPIRKLMRNVNRRKNKSLATLSVRLQATEQALYKLQDAQSTNGQQAQAEKKYTHEKLGNNQETQTDEPGSLDELLHEIECFALRINNKQYPTKQERAAQASAYKEQLVKHREILQQQNKKYTHVLKLEQWINGIVFTIEKLKQDQPERKYPEPYKGYFAPQEPTQQALKQTRYEWLKNMAYGLRSKWPFCSKINKDYSTVK